MPNFMRRSILHPAPAARRAFTLIELLVVIAIISILVALLFPVFATARESARQSVSITHLRDIQNALALYKLDNKSYPPVLFAYADGIASPNMGSAAQNGTNNVVGLYPVYVKDWHEFTSPDNGIDSPMATTQVYVNTLGSGTTTGGGPAVAGQLGRTLHTFYSMDAMDVSPEINEASSNQIVGGNSPSGGAMPGNNWTWMPRYQTSWDSYHPWLSGTTACPTGNTNVGCQAAADPASYLRQLRWTNPPPNTYVTSLSYHVPAQNVVLVLYESGTVSKSRSLGAGAAISSYDDTVADVSVLDANSDSTGNFWKFKANQ